MPIDLLPDTYRTLFTLWEVESFATTATAKIFGLRSAARRECIEHTSYFKAETDQGLLGNPYAQAN